MEMSQNDLIDHFEASLFSPKSKKNKSPIYRIKLHLLLSS